MNATEITKELNGLEKFLLNYALKLTLDHNKAKDLFQETAYRAIKHAHRCLPDTNTQAWLVTIMRNLFINDYRKKKRRATLQDGSTNTYLLDSSSKMVPNDGELNVQYEDLFDLVERLDDHLRIPFLMTYEGYKYEEIAEKLNVPLGTIKSRIFFARKRMQESIKHKYGQEGKEVLFAA